MILRQTQRAGGDERLSDPQMDERVRTDLLRAAVLESLAYQVEVNRGLVLTVHLGDPREIVVRRGDPTRDHQILGVDAVRAGLCEHIASTIDVLERGEPRHSLMDQRSAPKLRLVAVGGYHGAQPADRG